MVKGQAYTSVLLSTINLISGVAKITSQPSAYASGFDYILAPPSRVLVSQHRPSASGLIP
jgi:hypothetical protein